MQLGWLESLFYGLISGVTEFLPVSSEAHRALFLELTGSQDSALIRLAVHLGALISLLVACAPILSRLNRERRIAAEAKSCRRRQPDTRSMLDMRVLRTGLIPLLLCFVAWPFVKELQERQWLMAILLAVNGIFLYAPQFLPSANKDSQSMSSLDAAVMGLGAGAGVVPGLSRVGIATSLGLTRGVQRRHALDLSLLWSVPALAVLLVLDVVGIFGAVGAVTFFGILKSLLAGLAAFGSAWFGIFVMRFLSVRAGFAGFAYYSWGVALFSFILYLTI